MAAPPAQERGWRIGSFAGAAIIVDPTIVLLAAYVLGTAVLDGGVRALSGAALFLGALLTAVLLHEFGHASTAALLRIPSKRIVLTFFGGFVEFHPPPKQRWQEIFVSAAGPLTNLATYAVLLALVGVVMQLPEALSFYLDNLAYASFLLGLFNLLPGYPLDGGTILRALLSYAMRPPRARVVAAIIGLLIALALIAFAAWKQLWWSLFIGLILALNAWAEIQRASAALRAETQPPEPTTSNA